MNVLAQTAIGFLVIVGLVFIGAAAYQAWVTFGWWVLLAPVFCVVCWVIGAFITECLH